MINQLEELRKENAALKEQMAQVTTYSQFADTLSDTLILQNEITLLKLDLQRLANENDSLRKASKNSSEIADKEELINALTKALNKEKQLNEILTNQNKDLKEAIEKFKQ
jgi:hypothetical protein